MSLALSYLTDHLIHSSLHYMQECTNICLILQTAAAFKILKNVFRGWKKALEGGRNTWIWCQDELLFHSTDYTQICTLSAPGTWCSDYESAILWRHDGQTSINLQFKIFVYPETRITRDKKSHKRRLILSLATQLFWLLWSSVFCWSATWLQGFQNHCRALHAAKTQEGKRRVKISANSQLFQTSQLTGRHEPTH